MASEWAGDKRKRRSVFWKEARLSLVRHPTEITPAFAVTLGDAQACGQKIKALALSAGGLTRTPRVHASRWETALRGLPTKSISSSVLRAAI